MAGDPTPRPPRGLRPVAGDFQECLKCAFQSGNDWEQCRGECPVEGSPHFNIDCLRRYEQGYDERDTATRMNDPLTTLAMEFETLVWTEGDRGAELLLWPTYSRHWVPVDVDGWFRISQEGFRPVSRQETPTWFGFGKPRVTWSFVREVRTLIHGDQKSSHMTTRETPRGFGLDDDHGEEMT
jgi:hypothetical protein